MARYRGPKCKVSRKFGFALFGDEKYGSKKSRGVRATFKRGRKLSEYGKQLGEKQKIKYIYGILERQFFNMFKKASQSKGITGSVLIQLCESRLDNTVYRLGLSKTRRQSRQMVSHKHITVNGDVLNIPSYTLKPGDVVSVREKSASNTVVVEALQSRPIFDWLSWNPDTLQGTFSKIPDREMIPEKIQEQLVVELYSK